MVKPSQPKGIKPKAEISETVVTGGSSDLTGKKLIIVNTFITVIICTLFLGGNYLIVNTIVSSNLKNFSPQAENKDIQNEQDTAPQRGIILDLGEFILNLSDPSAKRYLKVNVALELSKAPHDPDLTAEPEGGKGEGKGEDPVKIIEAEMSQYKPAIRDAIISVLSSKTPEELSSLAGKELAKEQIKESINPLFSGEREVMRVSFGSFIIQ